MNEIDIHEIQKEIVQLKKKNLEIEGKKRRIEEENIKLEKEYQNYQIQIKEMFDSSTILEYLENSNEDDEVMQIRAGWTLGLVFAALVLVLIPCVAYQQHFDLYEAILTVILIISILFSMKIVCC